MSKFTDFFSNIGHGIRNMGKPIMNALSTVAPMAGTAVGGMFGGPMGMMAGNALGGMAGNLFNQISGGGGGEQAQTPQLPTGGGLQSQMPGQAPGQRYGMQFGNYLNQMLPEQIQDMQMGPLAVAGGGYLGGKLNNMLPGMMQPMGLGHRLGGYLGSQIASRLPAQYENQTLGGLGSMLGGQMGGRFGRTLNPMLQRFGYGMPQAPTTQPQPQPAQQLAYGGHVGFHSLRDMGDMMGHHFDDGGMVY